MNNKLIKTDSLWYKLTKFFRKIFNKETINTATVNNKVEKVSNQNISLKQQFEKDKQNRMLATNLMNRNISIESLSTSQVDEMINYFEKYIKDIDKRLFEVKSDIIEIRKNS